MIIRRLLRHNLVFLVLVLGACAAAQALPAPRVVNLKTSDGTILKATYFAATKPGPGILLLHQCNKTREIWDGLPERLAARGMNVLIFDYRGFGESGGTPFDKLSQEAQDKLTAEVWPHDIDLAYQYLVSQPGVERDEMGAGGASCGVDNAVQVAERHPEVKALMLLSGATDRKGRLFLQSKKMPVFTAQAADDEFGNFAQTMEWLYSVSGNSASRYQHYATGKHGAEMFAVHPELMDMIAKWFAATLMNEPKLLPTTNGKGFTPSVERYLDLLDQPGGASKVARELRAARKRNPKAEGPPEATVNILGYERLQAGDAKDAVEIMKLNVEAHPDSPNAYDSLGDAYVAAGEKDLAVESAKKALQLLVNDTKDPETLRTAIRDNAEKKLKQPAPSAP